MRTIDILGGETGIRTFVDELARRLDNDEVMRPLFAHVDLAALHHHRMTYLVAVLGGPENYTGRSMRDAHGPLNLTHEHMDHFLSIAADSLDAVAAPEPARAAVLDLLSRLRPMIVVPVASGADDDGGL